MPIVGYCRGVYLDIFLNFDIKFVSFADNDYLCRTDSISTSALLDSRILIREFLPFFGTRLLLYNELCNINIYIITNYIEQIIFAD